MKYKGKKILYLCGSYVLGVHYSAAGKCHVMITTTVNAGELNVVAVFLHEENPSICLIGSVSLSAIMEKQQQEESHFVLELNYGCPVNM